MIVTIRGGIADNDIQYQCCVAFLLRPSPPKTSANNWLPSVLSPPLQASHSLVATMALLAFFSLFIQAACGACYAILPFVSKRSTGLVSGMVAAAGTGGSAFTQVRCPAGYTYLLLNPP